jgi:hypothetical protein
MIMIKMIKDIKAATTVAIKHWKTFPKDVFLPFFKKGRKNLIFIKFRDSFHRRQLFNEVEPWKGVHFVDAISSGDYFIGEFIIVNEKLWHLVISKHALVLTPRTKFKKVKKELHKIRDDGFLKTYRAKNGNIIITTV